MNRIDKLFCEKKGNILSVFFTAGYPEPDSTATIIKALEDSGADMVEIGMPFSDPIADGPVIQKSNEIALRNGMNLKLLFKQLSNIRQEIKIPLILMGYLNPVMQFGVEDFCRCCAQTGIDGIILPDLPPEVYEDEYLEVFNRHLLYNILLISPQSSVERISAIDKLSRGFIYMVSSSSVTGKRTGFTDEQIKYFKRIRRLKLENQCLIGFGISDRMTFRTACDYSFGGIIGSAFVKVLGKEGDIIENINEFIISIKGGCMTKKI